MAQAQFRRARLGLPCLDSRARGKVRSGVEQASHFAGTRLITEASNEPVLLDVIRLIYESPRLTQRKLASSLGVSLGKANYCIRALIERGFVKAENYRSSSNKMAYLYVLTPSGVAAKAELTRYFLARKVNEYETLRLEIEQLRRESESSPQ